MAVIALAAVALAVVLFALTSINSSSTHSSGTPTTNAPGPSHSAITPAFRPSSVTVAVLNGTSVNQLAHRIWAKLGALGYKQGTVATAASQTDNTTVVAYLSGAKDRTDALHVASALGLRRTAVQRVDQSTLQIACPGPSACTANVVVTVGADLASS